METFSEDLWNVKIKSVSSKKVGSSYLVLWWIQWQFQKNSIHLSSFLLKVDFYKKLRSDNLSFVSNAWYTTSQVLRDHNQRFRFRSTNGEFRRWSSGSKSLFAVSGEIKNVLNNFSLSKFNAIILNAEIVST